MMDMNKYELGIEITIFLNDMIKFSLFKGCEI